MPTVDLSYRDLAVILTSLGLSAKLTKQIDGPALERFAIYTALSEILNKIENSIDKDDNSGAARVREEAGRLSGKIPGDSTPWRG